MRRRSGKSRRQKSAWWLLRQDNDVGCVVSFFCGECVCCADLCGYLCVCLFVKL